MKYSLLLLIFLSPVVAHAAIDDCMTRTSVPDEKLNLKQIVDLGLKTLASFDTTSRPMTTKAILLINNS